MHKRMGDTLIEVTLAVGIFSMVAIAAMAVLSGGTSSAQTALEATLAREEIDAQSEAIRFIQSAALAEDDAKGPYHAIWEKIIELSVTGYSTPSNQSCDAMYSNSAFTEGKAFVINTHALGDYADRYNEATNTNDKLGAIKKVLITSKDDKSKFIQTQTYPHLIYGNSTANTDKGTLINDDSAMTDLYAAAGIYVITVPDQGTSNIIGANDNDAKGFDDFYVQTCWYGSGSDTASTISTVIRLYNPQESTTQTTPTYKIAYNANGADAYSGGPETQTFKYEGPGKTTTVQDNTFSKLCYDPIIGKDLGFTGDKASKTVWTIKDYSNWAAEAGFEIDPEKENLKDGYENYFENKNNEFKNYLVNQINSNPSNFYLSGDSITIFPGLTAAPTSNGLITLYAQWNQNYNHEVCSPLFVKYTTTTSSLINSEGIGDPTEGSYSNAAQGFIIPDTRARGNSSPAAAAAELPYKIAASRIKYPSSPCKTSINNWQFISDKEKLNSDGKTITVDSFGSPLRVYNKTDFINIISAEFANGWLSVEKNYGVSSVYFNISCLAPSMQLEVDMDYCKENAWLKEITVRDERDGKVYKVEYIPATMFPGMEYDTWQNLIWQMGFSGYPSWWSPLDTTGLCVMTEDLRFEGKKTKKPDERDIEYTESRNENIGSNVSSSMTGDNGIDLVGVNPTETSEDTWKNDNGKAMYISDDSTTFYNFNAAFAGYQLPSPTDPRFKETSTQMLKYLNIYNGGSVQTELTSDICPANWRIVSEEFDLNSVYTGNTLVKKLTHNLGYITHAMPDSYYITHTMPGSYSLSNSIWATYRDIVFDRSSNYLADGEYNKYLADINQTGVRTPYLSIPTFKEPLNSWYPNYARVRCVQSDVGSFTIQR